MVLPYRSLHPVLFMPDSQAEACERQPHHTARGHTVRATNTTLCRFPTASATTAVLLLARFLFLIEFDVDVLIVGFKTSPAGASTTDDILKIRLQLTKPVTWIPLIWGVLCGAAASGAYFRVVCQNTEVSARVPHIRCRFVMADLVCAGLEFCEPDDVTR